LKKNPKKGIIKRELAKEGVTWKKKLKKKNK